MTTKPPVLQLNIGLSSSAIFDLSESHKVFLEQGVDAYREYQIQHSHNVLLPGPGFYFTEKLSRLSAVIASNTEIDADIRIVLLSRNSPETGVRVMHSLEHYGVQVQGAAFCGGDSPYNYATAFDLHLFLSANKEDVLQALRSGVPAARLISKDQSVLPMVAANEEIELRIAYDGDAVLFDSESEDIYREHGLDVFLAHESKNAHKTMTPGPFHSFARALYALQKSAPEVDSLIKTALVTARGGVAETRVRRTLQEWGIWPDQSFYLGKSDKNETLKQFGADIFFDDTSSVVQSASQVTTSGHVVVR